MTRSQLLLAAVALLVAHCTADSVPIGCYKYDEGLELRSVESNEGGSCSEKAMASLLTIWGEYDGSCYATAVVPLPALKSNSSSCDSGIALYYWMEYEDAADRWSCTAEALPLTDKYWGGLDTVELADGVATLHITGEPGSTARKFYSRRKSGYGVYSAEMSVPGPHEGGVVAMYTSTEDQSVPEKRINWDEIDYEILNSCGDKGCTPASGWANTFKEGVKNSHQGKVIWQDETVLNEFRRYTFSWHPNNIFWYKDDEFIYGESSDMHELPWQKQYTVFVIWYNDQMGCEYFGGCGHKGLDYTMKVRNIRQLTCTEN